MSRLLYSATMSLDGFIAGAGGRYVLVERAPRPLEPRDRRSMASIGALLVGKRTFVGDDPNRGTEQEGAFSGQWHGPSIVLTHERPVAANHPDVTFVDDLASAVAKAKAAAGGKYVNVLGANVAKQCVDAGLIDEIVVLIPPCFWRRNAALRPCRRDERPPRADPSARCGAETSCGSAFFTDGARYMHLAPASRTKGSAYGPHLRRGLVRGHCR